MGSQIPCVGIWAVCTALYCTVQYSTVQYSEAYCGLLSSGCGHEVSWEIPGVAYIRCVFSTKRTVGIPRLGLVERNYV